MTFRPLLAAARMLLVLLAAIPLVVDDGVLFPFVSAKALTLRVVVTAVALMIVAELVRVEEYRVHLSRRLRSLRRSPIALAFGVLLAVTLLSSITGVNTFRSIFGDAERAEGFAGLAALAAFFVLAYAVLEERDWTWFFRVLLLSAFVLLAHALWQRAQGLERPGSFTGQHAYLGPFAFFVIGAAIALYARAPSRVERLAALGGIPVALAIILVTQTRAAVLGAAVGGVIVAAFIARRAPRGSPARAALLRGFTVLALLGGMFVLTRDAGVWQRIPGIRRVAVWNADDPSTQWRLGVWEASMAAMSPARSGFTRVLVGWGPENVHYPVNREYQPTRFLYDASWYDRTHNMLVDSLLTTGILGLLASLALWAAAIVVILRSRHPVLVQGATLFVVVAYFVQNLVSFESLSTSVPFFAMLAFVSPRREDDIADASPLLGLGVAGSIAILAALLLLWQTLPAYSQMRRYVRLYRETVPLDTMLTRWSGMRRPWTYAQEGIRADFLPRTRVLVRASRAALPVLSAGVDAMEEVIRRDSLNARRRLELGEGLAELADLTGSPDQLRRSVVHLERAALLAPGKTHVRNSLAIARARAACTRHPSICHYETLRAMVAERNGEGALLVKERLDLLDPPRRAVLAQLAQRVRTGRWGEIHVSLAGDNVTITLDRRSAIGRAGPTASRGTRGIHGARGQALISPGEDQAPELRLGAEIEQ